MEHQSITPAGFAHIGAGGVWIIKVAVLLLLKKQFKRQNSEDHDFGE